MGNTTGSFRSVSREDKPARSASFVSLTSWLSKKMLFSWKFPREVSKWNNETQISVYTLSHMEVGRVSWGRKKTLFALSYVSPHASALGHCWRQTPGLRAPGAGVLCSSLCSCDSSQITNCCKYGVVGFRDRHPEGQVSITPSYSGLTIKST